MNTAADVLEGRVGWSVERGEVPAWLDTLPADSVDLVFGSPPYTGARLYKEKGVDLGIARDAEAWAAWMCDVTLAALRVCKGAVCWVIEGQTDDYRWDAAPFLLGADLVRRGVTLRRPCYYRRVGIPGSGGPDWFRCDAEIILCCTRGGKLPWADPTACGHPPRWAPGGAMSHRLRDGQRVNQWGMRLNDDGSTGLTTRGLTGDDITPHKQKPSHRETVVGEDAATPGLFGPVPPDPVKTGLHNGGNCRSRDGTRVPRKPHTKRRGDGDTEPQSYAPPVLANPGNVVQRTYTAEEVTELLGLVGEFTDCQVGGRKMGHPLAHKNEAPFPTTLAERFVLSLCPPGGVVLDCFSGSGTTLQVCIERGRRFVGCDLRQSQVDLSVRRGLETTPPLPGMEEG